MADRGDDVSGDGDMDSLRHTLEETLFTLRQEGAVIVDTRRIERLERLADVACEVVRLWENVDDEIMLYNRLNRLRDAVYEKGGK